MIEISSRAEYDLCIKNGFNPLINWKMFTMPIDLRIALQNELFGTADFVTANNKFYKYVWDNSIHNCLETGQPIEHFAAVHISHIISKGSDRRLATDPRNANVVIKRVHDIWEFGTLSQKKKLNIYPENQLIIKLLKNEYNIRTND